MWTTPRWPGLSVVRPGVQVWLVSDLSDGDAFQSTG